jgi:hypothetical protein
MLKIKSTLHCLLASPFGKGKRIKGKKEKSLILVTLNYEPDFSYAFGLRSLNQAKRRLYFQPSFRFILSKATSRKNCASFSFEWCGI